MQDREKNIVEAAIRVFSRYGVKRTTMNDIASEAGIVRQTLYNVFANKDDVLRAAIRWHTEESIAAIGNEIGSAENLGDQIDIILRHLAVLPFEQIHASPHAADIILGMNELAQDEIERAGKRYQQVIENCLEPHNHRIRLAGLSRQQLAEMIQTAAKGFKHTARDKQQLMDLLAALKACTLATTRTK